MNWGLIPPLSFVIYVAAFYWLFFMPHQRGLGLPLMNAERVYRRFFESKRKRKIRLIREERERNIDMRQRNIRKAGKSTLISDKPYV